jgi:hypothetical protein
VEQVGELFGLGVAFGVGEERVGVEDSDLRVAASDIGEQLVELADLVGGSVHFGGRREDMAEDDRHLRIVGGQAGEEPLDVGGDAFDGNLYVDVVRADEEDDGAGVEREHVVVESREQTAAGVAADAAVGGFHVWIEAAEIVAPTLRDGVAEEDEGVLLVGFVSGELVAALAPDVDEPVFGADGADAGGGFVGF